MSDPWFDPNMWAWLPGTALGVAGGLWGSLAGALGSKGKARSLIWGGYWLLLGVGVIVLAASVLALIDGQPYGVWYALLLPGALSLLVIAPLGYVVKTAFRRADEMKMRAQEFQ
jgi:hypothetical protein